jgi:hypothetical protein
MLVLLVGGMAWAQSPLSVEQQKLLSKRAAEADAYRKLAEAVRGVQITSDTYVKDFVAESDDIRAAVDSMIRGIRLGEPRWYSDLSCEVPAEITVARLVKDLKRVHNQHYEGKRLKQSDFEQINRNQDRKVIKVVGLGAPREDIPFDLPEGVAEKIAAPPAGVDAPLPAIWREIPAAARIGAINAARYDAMRQLIERIKGLRIDSDTVVRDFMTESDRITVTARGKLFGATEVGRFFHDNEYIVEMTVEVPLESVVSVIKELHASSRRGEHVESVDVEQIRKSIKQKTFQATGMGIPNPRFLQRHPAAASRPDWAIQPLVMTGQAVIPEDKAGTPQGRLVAARAAEVDAKRKLIEHILGLKIDSRTTISDYAADHDEIEAHVDGVLAGAVVEKTEFSGDVAQVTVSVPGMAVWQVISERQRVEALEPADAE